MKEFRIYAKCDECWSLNFKKFVKEVEERINSDEHIIESAKKCNLDFTEKVKKILSDSENDLFIGSQIEYLQAHTPRYSFVKNLEYNGVKYEAQIDELERTFVLLEV
jgi:hypothetical protein